MANSLLMNPKSLHSYNPIPYGCVGFFPLWSPGLSGPVFSSVDSFGHTCTVNGTAPVWGSQGWTLPGTDEYIDCGGAALLDNLPTLTYGVWVKPTTINESHFIFAKRHTKNVFISATSTLTAYAEKHAGGTTSPTSTSTDTVSTGNWYLILFTYDDTTDKTWRIYINNTEVGYGVQTPGVGDLADDSAYNYRLGHHQDSGSYLIGTAGEGWIYDHSFSAEERTYLYSQTKFRYL